jgi:hypothetical protein
VDARRCIAFHTIENRDPELPAAIADALEGWVAGCDICQDVCPWNHKPLPSSSDPDLQPRPQWLDLHADEALAGAMPNGTRKCGPPPFAGSNRRCGGATSVPLQPQPAPLPNLRL